MTQLSTLIQADVTLSAGAISTGIIDPARLGSGTPTSTKYLAGDNTWTEPGVTSVTTTFDSTNWTVGAYGGASWVNPGFGSTYLIIEAPSPTLLTALSALSPGSTVEVLTDGTTYYPVLTSAFSELQPGLSAASTSMSPPNNLLNLGFATGAGITSYTIGFIDRYAKFSEVPTIPTWSTLEYKTGVDGPDNVVIGQYTYNNPANTATVTIGNSAGYEGQGSYSVAIGYAAGYTSQGSHTVAIGDAAGNNTQGMDSVAMGHGAGNYNQGQNSVAIGHDSGYIYQSASSVAIGEAAGNNTQSTNSIAIGHNSGWLGQGANSIAIGYGAGYTSQGATAIAIGLGAGDTNQHANSIILNATGTGLDSTEAGLFVAPIRDTITPVGTKYTLTWDATTKEITGVTGGGGTLTTVAGTAPVTASVSGSTATVSMSAATTSVNGYLTSTDWTTFNGKQAALGFTPYNATNPSGYTANTGTVTGVTGTAPVVSSGGVTPAISMSAATTSVNGYLTSTDWTTFNGKAPTASPTFTGTSTAEALIVTGNSGISIGTNTSTGLLTVVQSATGPGTISTSSTSTSVTGVGTTFTSTFKVGDLLYIGGIASGIGSIPNDTYMTLYSNPSATVTGYTYSINASGTRLSVKGNGNVGIGTDTPASKLTVSGQIESTVTGFKFPDGTTQATAATITAPVSTITGAAGGTITPISTNIGQYTITALGAAATFAIPATGVDGQKLMLRIKDNGTARALTWTTSAGGYRIIGAVLPTTTVVSKITYVGLIYNSQDSYWDVVAVGQQL